MIFFCVIKTRTHESVSLPRGAVKHHVVEIRNECIFFCHFNSGLLTASKCFPAVVMWRQTKHANVEFQSGREIKRERVEPSEPLPATTT